MFDSLNKHVHKSLLKDNPLFINIFYVIHNEYSLVFHSFSSIYLPQDLIALNLAIIFDNESNEQMEKKKNHVAYHNKFF